jgi:hypothetical protein
VARHLLVSGFNCIEMTPMIDVDICYARNFTNVLPEGF